MNKQSLVPEPTIACCECGESAEWIGCTYNGDRFVVDEYDDDTLFDIYRCVKCHHVQPNSTKPLLMDEMGNFYEVESK